MRYKGNTKAKDFLDRMTSGNLSDKERAATGVATLAALTGTGYLAYKGIKKHKNKQEALRAAADAAKAKVAEERSKDDSNKDQ